MPPVDTKQRLRELAALFLKLGTTAFGGPAAHIAMMEEEVVRRRRWLSAQEFLDLLGATNLIPGPNSTEMAIHIGHRRAGWPGLIVAGMCFILPATLIVAGIAWAYVRFGQLPQVGHVLDGVKPVIIAIVVQALFSITPTAAKSKSLAALAVAAAVLNVAGVHELVVLFGSGVLMALVRRSPSGGNRRAGDSTAGAFSPGLLAVAAGGAAAAPFGLWPLFLFFLKVGSVLFGSGYVLLAFLRADLVDRWHWLTEAQLLDAIAVGQVTPGPVFTTATFIGYLLAGGPGVVVATLGIFLPAFIFVALSGPLVPRLRRSAITAAFLDGVNAASLALMAVVTWRLGHAALFDWFTVSIALASTVLLFRYRINSTWLILGGAVLAVLKVAWFG